MKRILCLLSLRKSAALIFAAVLFILPEAALSHTFPDHAEPKVGASLSVSPAVVRIWFDGALEPAFSTIVVQDAGGKKVDKGDGRVNPSDATLLEVSVPSLPGGIYHVIWDVVARDGHRTAGDYMFVIK